MCQLEEIQSAFFKKHFKCNNIGMGVGIRSLVCNKLKLNKAENFEGHFKQITELLVLKCAELTDIVNMTKVEVSIC